MQIIDLSAPICNNPSEPMLMKIQREKHKVGAKKMARNAQVKPLMGIKGAIEYFKYILGFRKMSSYDFPEGEFISLDTVTLPTHMGTHIDAPFHFGTKFCGEDSRTIDKLPIEWFYGNSIKLDLRHIPLGKLITCSDISNALNEIEYEIQPGDIVLIWTGMEEKWGKKEYFTDSPGMSKEAVKFLAEKGVRVMGIDAYGFDRSIPIMLSEYMLTKNKEVLWPAHMIGREIEYVHIERLINLNSIPTKNFKVACFPLRLTGCDASWIRAVALIEGGEEE
jgi:kynurenine formamidase